MRDTDTPLTLSLSRTGRGDGGAPAMGRAEAIVAEAVSWVGTPYRHQAALKGIGCDCLGLVRGIWRAVYGSEPEATPAYTPDWAEARGAETLATAAERHLVPVAQRPRVPQARPAQRLGAMQKDLLHLDQDREPGQAVPHPQGREQVGLQDLDLRHGRPSPGATPGSRVAVWSGLVGGRGRGARR